MLGRKSCLLIALFVATACQQNQVVEVKDFRIYAETQDPQLQHAIRLLAERYNQEIGSQALTIVEDASESNSRISFTEGLQNDGNKLGLGKWMTTTEVDSSFTLKGEKNKQVVVYGMDIEFDLKNFTSKAPEIDDDGSNAAKHLYHLFCHEIGHGLQMDHSHEGDSVMYPSIPDTATRDVDFSNYFDRARSFLEQ